MDFCHEWRCRKIDLAGDPSLGAYRSGFSREPERAARLVEGLATSVRVMKQTSTMLFPSKTSLRFSSQYHAPDA
jgi:hypothetical protein